MKSIQNIVLLGILFILGACSAEESLSQDEQNRQRFLTGIKGQYTTDSAGWSALVDSMGSIPAADKKTVNISELDFIVPLTGTQIITFTFQSIIGEGGSLWGIYKVKSPAETKYTGVTIGQDKDIKGLIYSEIKDTPEEVTESSEGVWFLIKDA